MIQEKDYSWFKKFGFYRNRQPYHGDCFVSIEEAIMSKPYLNWGIDNNPKPRYIYNIRSKSIHDNLDGRYLPINSIEEFVDFIQGKEPEIHYKQLDRNKDLYSQLGGNDYWGYVFNRPYAPNTGRRIRIQTGSAGMEEFNRALLEDRDIWSQRELTETPMLDMSEIGEPIRIGDTTVGRPPTPEILDPTRYLRTDDYYNIWMNNRPEIYLGERRPYQSDRVMATAIAYQNSELTEIQRQLNQIDEQARN